MNKCFITGRIAHDLELRCTSTGKSICEFRIATNRPVVRDGEKVADFITCRVWNKLAENLVKYQAKGNLIGVIGRMQVDVYKDKEDKNKYNTYLLVEDLEYLESKKDNIPVDKLQTKTQVQSQFDYDSSDLPF